MLPLQTGAETLCSAPHLFSFCVQLMFDPTARPLTCPDPRGETPSVSAGCGSVSGTCPPPPAAPSASCPVPTSAEEKPAGSISAPGPGSDPDVSLCPEIPGNSDGHETKYEDTLFTADSANQLTCPLTRSLCTELSTSVLLSGFSKHSLTDIWRSWNLSSNDSFSSGEIERINAPIKSHSLAESLLFGEDCMVVYFYCACP